MLKIKATDSALVRFGKQLLQGALLGAVIGLPLGIIVGYFGLEEGLTLPMDKILTFLSWLAYGAIILSLTAVVAYILAIRQEVVAYEGTDDEDLADELYRSLGKKIGFSQVFSGIALVLSLVNVLLTYKIEYDSDSMSVSFSALPFACLILSSLAQMYIISLNNRVRGIKMTLLPTMKELKENVMQLDEAEMQANYKMSFDIVMTLSGLILPSIYVILFFMAFIFQKVELTGILIATGIHLYIMVMNFKMTKDYFK